MKPVPAAPFVSEPSAGYAEEPGSGAPAAAIPPAAVPAPGQPVSPPPPPAEKRTPEIVPIGQHRESYILATRT